jgi:hypothetical protein
MQVKSGIPAGESSYILCSRKIHTTNQQALASKKLICIYNINALVPVVGAAMLLGHASIVAYN